MKPKQSNTMIQKEINTINRFDPKFRIFEIKSEFTELELSFMINHHNRNCDIDIDIESIDLVSIQFMIDLLESINESLLDSGQVFNHIILTKLKANK